MADPNKLPTSEHLRSIPERRPVSRDKRGIWLRIDHAHIARVLAIRADREGEV